MRVPNMELFPFVETELRADLHSNISFITVGLHEQYNQKSSQSLPVENAVKYINASKTARSLAS